MNILEICYYDHCLETVVDKLIKVVCGKLACQYLISWSLKHQENGFTKKRQESKITDSYQKWLVFLKINILNDATSDSDDYSSDVELTDVSWWRTIHNFGKSMAWYCNDSLNASIDDPFIKIEYEHKWYEYFVFCRFWIWKVHLLVLHIGLDKRHCFCA